jgi:alpha-D-xyloside xylohydrolase
MRRLTLALGTALILAAGASAQTAGRTTPQGGHYERTAHGIAVTPANGPARRLEVYGPNIVRVVGLPAPDARPMQSLMVTAAPRGDFTVREEDGRIVLSTGAVSAEVSLDDGRVAFRNAAGEAVLAETAPPAFAPVTVEGRAYVSIRQQFNRGTDEGFFGLGQHQNGRMNYNGEDVELAQHNMDIAIPFVVSTRGYGVLWDNNSVTRFGNPRPYALVGAPDDSLAVSDENGARGWTARYYVGDRLVATRQEPTIDYRYLDRGNEWPAGTRTPDGAGTVPDLRVVWTGRVTARTGGLHRFRLYASSYFRMSIDGRAVIDRWRQNWNPWYHNVDARIAAGGHADILIEWRPDGGYIGLLHNEPQDEADRHSLSLASEVGTAADYYFVAGGDMDGVIAGYRALTGKAELLPRWAYGFWQSRERYETQDQLVGVVEEYRRRGLPLDNIVQDWFYWPEDQWGSHRFDPARFPDPKGMIDRVHALGAHFMISVWPKFYPDTDHYRALDAIGAIYRRNVEAGTLDWVGPGYRNAFYDPYNPRGRELYWAQIRDNLARLGVDAWWLDADEPDIHSNLSVEELARRIGPNALGPGAAFFNSYPIVHVGGLADNLVRWRPDVRPFILTRSAFGGIQRASAAAWSGDVPSRWEALREQISAGVNYSMSGAPNWTHDIGGFAVEARFAGQDPAALDEWRELNTRWFQFGAFSPLFRSHGQFPRREIWEIAPEGTPAYEAMAWYDRLRYRLLPYIYALAADTYWRDDTIMRGLVTDFPQDRRAWGVDDEYLFGRAFLVAPVTEYRARAREVYLPAGARWFDFYTGEVHEGGQTIRANAAYERMPLFVRAGSIVPTGPAVQHSGEGANGPITLLVYPGADGAFSLYEDDGTSRAYRDGAHSRIPVRWDEASGTLTIGAREGRWSGMPEAREIRVLWMAPGRALDLDAPADARVNYRGEAVTLRRRG